MAMAPYQKTERMGPEENQTETESLEMTESSEAKWMEPAPHRLAEGPEEDPMEMVLNVLSEGSKESWMRKKLFQGADCHGNGPK